MKRLLLPVILAAALSAAESPVAPAVNAFTTAAYQQFSARDANLILSPFNIWTALSMALAGARGQTAAEIRSVLHLRPDSSNDAALAALLADLTRTGNADGNQLHAANALWVQKGFAILAAFEGTLAKHYHAPLTPLDFQASPESARAQINRWTEEHTAGKIQNLFPPGSLDAQTRLALTSAIYFYGKWQAPFSAASTQSELFTLSSGSAIETPFMNQTGHFGYTETPSAQILEMAYAGSGIVFDVLLPKTAAGLPDLSKSLSPDRLTGWLGTLADRNVQVSVPKFRVESAFSLRQSLSAMGMPAAFTSKADFSGISTGQPLALSEVAHKAFVDVAEQGTEAAAATGIAMRATAMRMPEKAVVFRADHPFLFLIRDTRTGVVLFIGRLTDPRGSK